MALTPEDVVNKRFQHVKFRDGYDQDEVDDFLDEVVVEIRRLYQENDELRQKLSTAEQRVKELEAGGASAPAAPVQDADATQAMPAAVPAPSEATEAPAPKAEKAPEAPAAPVAEEQTQAPVVKEAAPAPQQSEPAPSANAAPAATAGAAGTAAGLGLGAAASDGDAHGLIALAQRVHDEHVAEGERKRDELIKGAEKEAADIVGKAESKRDETLSTLESQKSTLERSIDQLSNFERQYRTRLKSYLNDQLRDLENSTSLAPETLDGNNPLGTSNHKL
ncbi:DivIVA domain-containing protein [Brevibacterium sp. GP-SGM9]|uniref:DivIVA domain-containing protein n=1 Tax=unclassified Brevibacterium TaxID=2614124 RepID=UPI001E3DC339|nr:MULTISPECIES: DivIVA domain-containing protein [unclassified Brevibacterium]MCD1285169.1 cell division protein DivIVA [Brevibacterium sp. CCUG 69071]MDK8435208.1 DivIVA domain-containing protein [Brevibacterium sp. H-BE7]